MEAAKTYLQTVSPQKMVDQMMDSLANNQQLHLSAADIAEVKSSIDIAALNKTSLDAMVKIFNLDELKMLSQFYGSPTGQSIVQKMPAYMSEVMPAIQMQVRLSLMNHLQKMGQTNGSVPAATPSSAPSASPAKP